MPNALISRLDRLEQIAKDLAVELVRLRADAEDSDRTLSVHESAEYASVDDTTIRRWIRDGNLPSLQARKGGKVSIRKSDLDSYLKAKDPAKHL